MSKNSNESFASIIQRASELPDDTGFGANVDIPQLFAQFPVPPGEKIIDNLPEPDIKNVQGVPKYNFRAHLKRFIIGQIEVGRDERGNPQFTSQDDSTQYEELMNDILDAAAILRWEERTTLRDGTMVIAVSYLTPKPKSNRK